MWKHVLAFGAAWVIFATGGICRANGPLPGTGECIPLSLAPLALPPAVQGTPYSCRIPTYGGHEPVSIAIASGALPPGIVISPAGEISGVPKTSGNFDFVLLAADSCQAGRQQVSRQERLVVLSDKDRQAPASVMRQRQLKLKVVASPGAVSIGAGAPAEQEVSYDVAAQPAETVTLHSPGASFSVAGAVIESVSAPLSVAVINGKGVSSEKVSISPRVRAAAGREKARIVYSRPFSGRQATDVAVVEFNIE